jgi:hypothetical protein
MATITINVADNLDKDFRGVVEKNYGIGKGILGKAVSEALEKWIDETRQKDIAEKMIAVMEKGFDMGKITYKSKDELYER